MFNTNDIRRIWSALGVPRDQSGLRSRRARRGGFTLIEVMFASVISLILLMSLLETLSTCRRMAANVKWRLAADALAYDTAWTYFNEQTSWFDERFPEAQAKWETVSVDRTSVWFDQKLASLYWSVTPVGVPTTKWIIRTNVQWPLPGGGFSKLPDDYVIERHRADRNLFRVKQ